MPTKTYSIDPTKFANLQQDLADAGAPLTFTDPTKNTGSFTPPGHGEITLGFAYANGVLVLTILHSAWYESSGAIWDGLAPYLGS